jgi:hypothetical protein
MDKHMDFQNKHQVFGRGTVVRGDSSYPASIVCSYPEVGPGRVECTVYLDEDIKTIDPIEIKATTDRGTDIWIPQLFVKHSRGMISHNTSYTITGSSDILYEGDLRPIEGDGALHIAYTVFPTPLATVWESFSKSYDGSIVRNNHGHARRGITWSANTGSFELSDIYTYRDTSVGFNSIVLRAKEYKINFWAKSTNYASLQEAVTEVAKELEDALRLCTLLSRSRVDWFQADARFIPSTQDEELRQHTTRDVRVKRQRTLAGNRAKDSAYDYYRTPVSVEALREGLFERLLNDFRSSDLYATVNEAILQLIVSRETNYFEPSLGILYSSLEGIVDGVSNKNNISYTLGSSAFEKLSKSIRKTIRESILDESVQKGIIAKIAELRRRSFKDKLIDVVKLYDVDPAKLWLEKDNLEKELYSLILRRNEFIHQGRMTLIPS